MSTQTAQIAIDISEHPQERTDHEPLGLMPDFDKVAELTGAWIIAVDGTTITYVNQAVVKGSGHPQSALVGSDIRNFLDAKTGKALSERSLARRRGEDVPSRYDINLKTVDGESKTIDAQIVPLRQGGRFLTVCVGLDITARRAAERQMEHAVLELEAFSSTVAHDLRAPLQMIDGFAAELHERLGLRLDDDEQRYFRHVFDASQRMRSLIDRLLDLARAGSARPEMREVDLSGLARAIVTELLARDQGDPPVVHVDEGLRVEADCFLLRIVLFNLMDNAFKFSAQQARREISVRQLEIDGEPVVCVSDNGPGFERGDAARLFEPFVRLDNARAVTGHGIGLATVRRAVQRLGGRVWADRRPDGQGARFLFTLGSFLS